MQVSDPRRLCGVNRSADQVSRPYRRSQGLTPTHKEVHTPACVRTSAAQGTHACAHSPCSIQTFYTCTPEPSGWGCLLHVYTFPAFLQRIIQSSIVTSIRIIYTQSTPGPMQFTKEHTCSHRSRNDSPKDIIKVKHGPRAMSPSKCLPEDTGGLELRGTTKDGVRRSGFTSQSLANQVTSQTRTVAK